MTTRPDTCQVCGGADLFHAEADSKGGYGPDLLPLVGSDWKFWKVEKLEIVVCGDCGNYRLFVPQQYLAEIRQNWKRVSKASAD